MAIINALETSYNALDNGNGSIHIHVYSDGDRVFIKIQDNGKGIREELLEKVRREGLAKANLRAWV